jgi:hypothetical protein
MSAPPINPDPAGERSTLADNAAKLTQSNIDLASTVRKLTERVSFRTRVFVSVLVLDALLTCAIAFFGYRYETASACQASHNDAFKAALIQRNEAAAKERAAQRKLFDTTLNANATTEQRRNAAQEYYAGLIAADQQRSANPLLTGNCG